MSAVMHLRPIKTAPETLRGKRYAGRVFELEVTDEHRKHVKTVLCGIPGDHPDAAAWAAIPPSAMILHVAAHVRDRLKTGGLPEGDPAEMEVEGPPPSAPGDRHRPLAFRA